MLFWHDHFATSDEKVDDPKLMTNQNGLIRANWTVANFDPGFSHEEDVRHFDVPPAFQP